jgi:hypothetical protein
VHVKVQVITTWNFLGIWSKYNLELHGIEKATKLMDGRDVGEIITNKITLLIQNY